ncbi:hypothetical protein BYT27DRAFT_7186768 [Phlegmacium glaucopus]|nr:hypothetical protein BYT27DRAFT_7186768 [Phlegmacium glaucopus]
MYSQHSLSNDTYHSRQHQQHDPDALPPQPYRYHRSSSPPASPTDLNQSPSNHDMHRYQTHGTDLIGRAVQFSTGQFAGQTIRMELQEIQKADLGRKYARVDRRPLDPPPVVLLRMFLVHHPGSNRETERELNYDDVQVLGLLCTVDLFPVAVEPPSPGNLTPDISYKGTLPPPPPAQPSSISPASPSSSSSTTHSPTQYHQSHGSPPSYRFVSDAESPSTSKSSGSKKSASHYSGYILPTHSSSDVVHRFGNYPITETSKQTQALVGATFVQPALVDYQGAKSIVFVFADLAVKIEGTFILRYRVFDIFSRPYNDTNDLAITAECYGGMFRVYSTKEFPGLQASTELTKHLARWGVRLNIRETERRRRKRNERRSVSPEYAPLPRKRKHMDSETHGYTSEDG